VQFSATTEQAGKRLDQALHEQFPEFSRARLQDWIKRERVLVNGAPRAPPACCARATASTWNPPNCLRCAPNPKPFHCACSTKTTTSWPSTSPRAWWCTPAPECIPVRW
jgi:hypothetical protein